MTFGHGEHVSGPDPIYLPTPPWARVEVLRPYRHFATQPRRQLVPCEVWAIGELVEVSGWRRYGYGRDGVLLHGEGEMVPESSEVLLARALLEHGWHFRNRWSSSDVNKLREPMQGRRRVNILQLLMGPRRRVIFTKRGGE
jgi:hypothetical protein